MRRHILLFVIASLLTGCSVNDSTPSIEQKHSDLIFINSKTLDKLAIRPGQRFTQYKKLLIEPLKINYSSRRRSHSVHHDIKDFQFNEKEQAIFNKKFNKAVLDQWGKSLGWQLADTAANDTLILRTQIDDLYLYASIKNNHVGITETLANETSTMIVSVELIDSQSGEILLSSKDKKTTGWKNSDISTMNRVNSVRYWGEAYRTFSQWARSLSPYLANPEESLSNSK